MKRPACAITILAAVAATSLAWSSGARSVCAQANDEQPALTPRKVDDAIGQLQRYLLRERDEDAQWAMPQFADTHSEGGVTALVTYALLSSGMSRNHPTLNAALGRLENAALDGTYSISLRAHIWSRSPERFRPALRRDARWLERAADGQGRFTYSQRAPGDQRFDHSATQYGVLGLWEAAKRGVGMNERVWDAVRRHLLEAQHEDGGWGYRTFPGEPSTGSMTAAGLTMLLIARERADARRDTPEPRTQESIDAGLAWLNENFKADENPSGRWLTYYLFSIERAGLASGETRFNGQLWYESGARTLLRRQQRDGRVRGDYLDRIDSAFALAFLARGRHPVWAGKLRIPGHDWNQRPHDLARFTRWLSHVSELEQHWQVIDVQRLDVWSKRRWTPIVWLCGSKPIDWSSQQVREMKRYLDRGGMLVVNPDRGTGRLVESVEALGMRLYPGRSFQEAGEDHAIYQAWFPVRARPPVRTLSNGARDLIVILGRDWSPRFQAGGLNATDSAAAGPIGASRSSAWRMMANLWSHASGRGRLPPRLASRRIELPPEPRRRDGHAAARDAASRQTQTPPAPTPEKPARDRRASPTRERLESIRFARLRYEGDWNVEPRAWEFVTDAVRRGMSRITRNKDHGQTGVATPLQWTDLPITQLAFVNVRNLPFAHLAGVETRRLTPREAEALLGYIRRGGTVLVETVAGEGDFAASLRAQLRPAFDHDAMPLSAFSSLVDASDLPPPATPIEPIALRPAAAARFGPQRLPRLRAFFLNDDPRLIFSDEDLSLGMLGVERQGLIGYAPETARRIAMNLLVRSVCRAADESAAEDRTPEKDAAR